LARRARQLLDEIRPSEREALVLRFAAELSFRELGAACGIDEAAARKRVSRGLQRLRSLLNEDKS
jgi:RNA polymerase sigma-70 factor (ECF subfamily)